MANAIVKEAPLGSTEKGKTRSSQLVLKLDGLGVCVCVIRDLTVEG